METNLGITSQINKTIEILKHTDIDGCITGSSMLGENFDTWSDVPDIDVFVYQPNQQLYAIDLLMFKYGFEPMNAGEKWKIDRVKSRGMQKSAYLSTVKLIKNGVIVNISYKTGKNNMFNVLSSFDMSIIMIGYDIKKKILLDLRCGWGDMVVEDPNHYWSNSTRVAVPNPLRDQDVDMYGVEMWVRQFDRCIKYWNRGFDTRPMAKFYIDSVNRVISDGALFSTDKSVAAYTAFVEEYAPMRDKMEAWLASKEEC